MNNKFRTLIAILLPMALIVGCSHSGGRFSSFTRVPERGWAYGDTISIVATDLDSLQTGRIFVGLHHDNNFLYSNLWLEVSYRDAYGRAHTDTVNIPMADNYGRWLGHGLGTGYQCEIALPDTVTISDSCRISVRHIMRVDTIRGIDQIGITVDDVNQTATHDS